MFKLKGPAMCEAYRLARKEIEEEILSQGLKPSQFKTSDITEAASQLLESAAGAELIKQALANTADIVMVPPIKGQNNV